MAFVYEVNGQKVEFDKEPTEKDIDEAAKSLGAAPSARPESAMSKPVEGAGGAAFGVYRPAGRRPESQQNREAAKEMPIQTARGVVTGTLGAIPDVLNLPGNLYGAATGQESPYKVPLGSEDWNKMLPFESDTPHAKLARFGGEALAPFPSAKMIRGAAAVPGAVADVTRQLGKGAMEGINNPAYRANPNSAFAEVGNTFYPNKTVEPWMAKTPEQQVQGLSALEASRQPSSSLFQTPGQKIAAHMAETGPQGGKLLPLEGQTVQAFGEQTARDFMNNPLKSLGSNLAGPVAGAIFGGPVGAIAGLGATPLAGRALELWKLHQLQKTAGLKPGFAEQLGQAQQTAGRLGIEGNMPPATPALGYTPATGPAKPTMYVNPQGQATTNLAGTQVNMNPGSMAVPTPAANAAMATTQAKAAGPVAPRAPAQPRPVPQPRTEFALPDVAAHYNAAAQGSTNFGDTFNKAVQARTADLLKDAKQRGVPMTPAQAEDLAHQQVKDWRSQNVEAFKPQPVAATPEVPTAPRVKREPVYNNPGEMRKALVGKVSPEEMDRLVREKFPAVEPAAGPVAPTPVAETPKQTRDMSVKNARAQAYKDLEDDTKSVDEILNNFEGVFRRKQMGVYTTAYDAAIAAGKDEAAAKQAGNTALRQAGMPLLSGERAQARLAPKESTVLETQMAQAWYDDLVKGADKQTKKMYEDLLASKNGDVGQLYRDMSAKQAGKETGKSMFEELPGEKTTFESKQDFKEQEMMDALKGETTTGSYPEGKDIVSVEQTNPFATANLPKAVEDMLNKEGRLKPTTRVVYEELPADKRQAFAYDKDLVATHIQKNNPEAEVFKAKGVMPDGRKFVLDIDYPNRDARAYVDNNGKMEFYKRYDMSKKPRKPKKD